MKTFDQSESNSSWNSLYKIGSVCSALMVIIILSQFIVFMVAPPPLEGTATDWFALFQQNQFMGLLAFELLMVIYTILSIPLALAFFAALRRVNPSLTAIYMALTVIGVVSFIVARPAFEMLFLSGQYAAATTDAQRSMFLAAGETLVAMFHGTAFQVSYFLGSIGGLLVSAVMLKSNVFSKSTAYMRIASSLLDFGLFIPTIGLFLSLLSVVCLLIWNILVARRLWQLGKVS
jgi:hypothetical protein